MAIELNITPQDIETIVKESIIKAGIGKAITDGISSALNGYDSPVKKAVKEYVGELASGMVRDKFSAQIKIAVHEAVEKQVTQETINATIDKTINDMAKAAKYGD